MTPVAFGSRQVLVTGASGFIGQHACRFLADAGYTIRGLTRRSGTVLPEGVAHAVVQGLTDRAGLRRAVEGCTDIVHLAARVHVMREDSPDPGAAFHRVNVEGTQILLDEAVRAGVQTFVLASTVKVMGESNRAPWSEEDDPRPETAYGVSKLAAERAVATAAESGDICAPILRLPLVYGPGMRANMLRLFQLVDRGIPLPLDGVGNRRSLLYVGNLAAAVEHVLHHRLDGPFFVADDWHPSTPELIRAIATALQRPVRLLPCPHGLLGLGARLGDLVDRRIRTPLTSRTLERILGSLEVSTDRLRRTGFAPPYPPPTALAATAGWYRATG